MSWNRSSKGDEVYPITSPFERILTMQELSEVNAGGVLKGLDRLQATWSDDDHIIGSDWCHTVTI